MNVPPVGEDQETHRHLGEGSDIPPALAQLLQGSTRGSATK